MKRLFFLFLLFASMLGHSQTVFGYWYGHANVKTKSSANNYMIELILQPEKDNVKGVLNYYFKDTYRSIQVTGTYDAATRQLSLNDIPLIYHGSIDDFEVDCLMNMLGILRVSQAGSYLSGSFTGHSDYKYICADVGFSLKLDADMSKKDSVQKAIREYRKNYEVWKPASEDTFVAVTSNPRKFINPVIEQQYAQRENVIFHEIEVATDSLKVDFYDNGEIDGDSISVFLNNKLVAYHQKLSTHPVHFDMRLDSLQDVNELTMFAENLGTIPPNTALMIIYDGVNRYEVHLSSTLEKNATLRIKRKKGP